MQIKEFNYNGVWVSSPDSVVDAIAQIGCYRDAYTLILMLANAFSGDHETKQNHIRHACKVLVKLDPGPSDHIMDAINTLW